MFRCGSDDFFEKFRTPAMIDPMIPGNAAAALPASLPRSRARALSLFLIHSLSFLGFFGGVEELLAPVNALMRVEMIKPIEVKTAVIVNPCSLKTSLSFSQRLRSSSRIFSTICRIREN